MWQMESDRGPLYLEQPKEQMVFVCVFKQEWRDTFILFEMIIRKDFERTETHLKNDMVSKRWGCVHFMCYKRKRHVFFLIRRLPSKKKKVDLKPKSKFRKYIFWDTIDLNLFTSPITQMHIDVQLIVEPIIFQNAICLIFKNSLSSHAPWVP